MYDLQDIRDRVTNINTNSLVLLESSEINYWPPDNYPGEEQTLVSCLTQPF